MSVLARRLWTEPAAFIAVVVAVLQVAQVLAVHDRAVNAVIGAVLLALGGQQTRKRVTPVAKP